MVSWAEGKLDPRAIRRRSMRRRKGRRRWTPRKRKRARAKAEESLRERRRVIQEARVEGRTQYFGMVLLIRWARKHLSILNRLRRIIVRRKGTNATYPEPELALAYIVACCLGLDRAEDMQKLVKETLLAEQIGLPQFPSPDTVQGFLNALSPWERRDLEKLVDRVRRKVDQTDFKDIDLDITGLPSYGTKREGVEPGYSQKGVRPCLKHPRITCNGYAVEWDLLPGNENCQEWVDRVITFCEKELRRSPRVRILLRWDAGLSSLGASAKLQALHERYGLRFHYIVAIGRDKVPCRDWIDELWKARNFERHKVGDLTWVCKTRRKYGINVAPKGVRLVPVLRGKRKTKRGRGKRRRSARSFLIAKEGYLLATSYRRDRLGEVDVFRRYHDRQGDSEHAFRNSKQSMHFSSFSSQKMNANRAQLDLRLLAENIVKGFQSLFVGGSLSKCEIHTLGRHLLQMPARAIEGALWEVPTPYNTHWRVLRRVLRNQVANIGVRLCG